MSQSSQFLTIILMFIGGCPGSTAGGIKVTTIAVLILYLRSTLTRTDGVNIFKRRMEDDAISKAAAVFTTHLLLAVVATFLISMLQNLDLTTILFDVVSAVSTVGMSTGVTPSLVPAAKVILIILMYLGRVGSLSFAMSFTDKKTTCTRSPAKRAYQHRLNIRPGNLLVYFDFSAYSLLHTANYF